MKAEDFQPGDKEQVARIHGEMGFDYKMPNLDAPQFVAKKLVRWPGGGVCGAAGLRIQAEAYLWLDPKASLGVRYKVVHALSFALAREAWRIGLDSVVAYLPPGLTPVFRKFLHKLGWSKAREGWEPWCKEIE